MLGLCGGGVMYTRLKVIRKAKGYTQQDMAELLGYRSKSGYCQLENGKTKMTIEKAKKIGKILKIDPLELFFK